MASFLMATQFMPLAKYIRARNPLRARPIKGWDPKRTSKVVHDIDEISALVSEIEDEGKGIPVLLRQYLKLGGKLLGFNVDPSFGDVLDGLILVDLRQTDPRMLERYLGKENTATFLAYHQKKDDDLPTTEKSVIKG